MGFFYDLTPYYHDGISQPHGETQSILVAIMIFILFYFISKFSPFLGFVHVVLSDNQESAISDHYYQKIQLI